VYEYEEMIHMTERAVGNVEVICQSSLFRTSILNLDTWFWKVLLFRMSNTSSSWPKQEHVFPKMRRHY